MSTISEDDKQLLRAIRHHLHEAAQMMQGAAQRGYAVNVRIDGNAGVADVQISKMVPINLDDA